MNQIKLVSNTIDQEEIQSLIGWLNQTPTPQLTKGPIIKINSMKKYLLKKLLQ